MPIHDWTQVDSSIFHDFHHTWISQLARALNRGLTSTGYYAILSQIASSIGQHVHALERLTRDRTLPEIPTSVRSRADAGANPKVRYHIKDVPKWYAGKKKSVTIRHVSD